jgi:hypothetical protein
MVSNAQYPEFNLPALPVYRNWTLIIPPALVHDTFFSPQVAIESVTVAIVSERGNDVSELSGDQQRERYHVLFNEGRPTYLSRPPEDQPQHSGLLW